MFLFAPPTLSSSFVFRLSKTAQKTTSSSGLDLANCILTPVDQPLDLNSGGHDPADPSVQPAQCAQRAAIHLTTVSILTPMDLFCLPQFWLMTNRNSQLAVAHTNCTITQSCRPEPKSANSTTAHMHCQASNGPISLPPLMVSIHASPETATPVGIQTPRHSAQAEEGTITINIVD